MSNSGRNHLVTRFRCTDCGEYLDLSYEPKEKLSHLTQRDEVVTGASKVENTLYIEPCRGCVGKAQRPIALMREALRDIGETP